MDEEKKENEQPVQEGGQEGEQPKKEGKISGFFKKLGKKIEDSTYDMRAENDFKSKHAKYCVYYGASAFSPSSEIYGDETDGTVLGLGEDEDIKAGCVIVRDGSDDAYYIDSVEKAEITYVFEDKENVKPATKIKIGAPAEKVDVIKVGDNYYIKK